MAKPIDELIGAIKIQRQTLEEKEANIKKLELQLQSAPGAKKQPIINELVAEYNELIAILPELMKNMQEVDNVIKTPIGLLGSPTYAVEIKLLARRLQEAKNRHNTLKTAKAY